MIDGAVSAKSRRQLAGWITMVSGRSRPGHCRGSTLHFQREVAQLTGVVHVVDSCVLRRLALWLRSRRRYLERLMFARLLVVLALCFSGHALALITPTSQYFMGIGSPEGDVAYSSSDAVCSAAAPLRASGPYAPNQAETWTAVLVSNVAQSAASGICHINATRAGDGYTFDDPISWRKGNVSVCPANSVGTDSCVCNAGFTDSGHNTCTAVPNCKAAGTTLSSGYYDTGASMASGPKVLVCSGGCQAIFDGTFPAGTARVGASVHYFARGSYHAAEGTCSPSDTPSIGTAPTANTSVPADKCAAGEVAGTINGKASCVSGTTGSGTVSSVPGNSSTSGTSVAQNPDGSSDSTTTTTTTSPDGSTSTTASVAHTNANGTSGGTTTTTSGTGATNGTGAAGAANTGAGTGSNTTPDDGSNPCKTNPAGSGCGGTPGDVPSLWTAKDKTVGTVLTNAKNTLMASGIGSGVSNFFTVQQGGTCPPSTWAIAYFHTTISVGTFCTDFAAQMFLVIRGVLLLVATFMAFRAAIE